MNMDGKAFISMMRQDLVTNPDNERLLDIVELMDYVVIMHPGCEIDHTKNAEDAFQTIFRAAQSAEKTDSAGNRYGIVGHEASIRIMIEYLGLTDVTPKVELVRLEDFL